jgi:hypothetical protein
MTGIKHLRLAPAHPSTWTRPCASNAKAKREFDWQSAFPSWRTGFEALYLDRPK